MSVQTMNLKGKQDRSSACIKDEDGIHLRDVDPIRERWAPHTIVAHSPERQCTETLSEHHRKPRLVAREHASRSSVYDAGADRRNPLLAKGKAVGSELFKNALNSYSTLRRRLLDIVGCIWRRRGGAEKWGEMSPWCSYNKWLYRMLQLQGHLACSACLQDTYENHRLPPQ